MTKKQLIFSIFSLFATLFLFVMVVYAWMPLIKETQKVVVVSGDVSGTADLYVGLDNNLDGILDQENGEDIYKYVSSDVTNNALVVSGKVLSYKFVVKNTGSVKSKVELGVSDVAGFVLIKIFAFENIRYCLDSEPDNIVEVEGGQYMPNLIKSDGSFKTPFFTYDGLAPGSTMTIFFQLSCLSLSKLISTYDDKVSSNFIQELNYQIYVEEHKEFKIEKMLVFFKSTY